MIFTTSGIYSVIWSWSFGCHSIYLPPLKTHSWILCVPRVQWRSTRSAWMRVESMWASAQRTGRWGLPTSAFTAHANPSHTCPPKKYCEPSLSFISGTSSPPITLIITFSNLHKIIWNWKCAIESFHDIWSINPKLYPHVIYTSTIFLLFSWFRKSLKACANFTDSSRSSGSDVQSCQSAISRQQIPSPCSLPYLLSCRFSSLPPSFMGFAVKICSLISPLRLLRALWWQKTRSCHTKSGADN